MKTGTERTVQILKWRYADKRAALIQAMDSLGSNLVNTARNMKANDDYPYNSLGEVQVNGSLIDRLCGELCVLSMAIAEIEAGLEVGE